MDTLHRRILLATCAGLCLALGWPAPAHAEKLRVVTTLPDLADIVREIGGDRVDVTALCRGRENTHAVTAKPSHLVAMNRADLFVQIGLSLEVSFVPGLLEGARNAKIQPGKPGFLNVSEGWSALEVPAQLSRKEGDVHPQGNPHLNLDPRAGKWIADKVAASLKALDPGSKELYAQRHADYTRRVEEASKRWSAMAAAWKDKPIVVYHKEYEYFAAFYALRIVGSIEPKPGIPPTPSHIAGLVDTIKRERVNAIVTAVWSNNSTVAELARQSGAKVVEAPNMCGGMPGADTWIGMMDVLHQRLDQALGAVAPPR